MSEAPVLTGVNAAADSLLGRLADQMLEARQHGVPVDVDELAAEYPELADVIRLTFPALQALCQTESAAISAAIPDGRLGDFRLVRELGRGGMGVVYEALQLSLNRRVALKVLPLAGMLDERRLRRFQNEAQAAAALQHPHIVPVYGVGCECGVHYYAMQLIQGASLADVLRRLRAHDAACAPSGASTAPAALLSTLTARPSDRFRAVVQLGVQAASALAYAHGEGVIHRDIKPSNLLLDEQGKLWVTDFGLARIHTDGELTLSGELLGTLRYMSPEQLANNKVVDQRTDIYSLGLTLYEMLAGAPAFADVPGEQLVQRILVEDPRSLRKVNPSVSSDLETVILRATAKDRDARYQSAEALAADLQRILECKPILARRPTRWQHLRYWARRNPTLAITTALLVLAASALSIGGPAMAWRQQKLADAALHNLFVSDMNLAYDAWYRGHVDRAEELLDKYVARLPHYDSRDFAYAYLRQLSREAEATVLLKREERFDDVAVAPNGRTVALGGRFLGIQLLDLQTRQQQTLPAPDAGTNSLDFSPEGDLLVAGAGPNVSVWDAQTWQPLQTLTHNARVFSVRFAPDGQSFAVGMINGELVLWDRAGKQLWSSKAHQGKIWSPVFSPDGKTIATVSEDHHVKLWDAATGDLKKNLARLGGPVFDIAWGRDGQVVIVAGAEGVQFWDPESGTQLRGLSYSLKPIASLAVHGDLLATGGHDHLVNFWSVDSGLPLGKIVADRAQVTGLEFTVDGKQILAAGGDGTVRLFDLADALETQQRTQRVDWAWPVAVAITADGSTCVSVAAPLAGDQPIDDKRGELVVWDVSTGKRRRSTPVAARFGADVALSTDAGICASAGWGGVELWDLTSPKPSKVLVHDAEQLFWTVAVSPDGRWVAAGGHREDSSGPQHGLLRMWDLANPNHPHEVELIDPIHRDVLSLAFAENSRQLAVAGGDWVQGAVDVWTCAEDDWRLTAAGVGAHGQISTDTAFVPNTDYVASSGYDGVIGMRHITDRAASRSYRTHIQAVFSLAVASDGKLIASGADREIRLWDGATGEQLATLQVPMWVSSLAFTPDNQTLIWGGGDGTVGFLRAGRPNR